MRLRSVHLVPFALAMACSSPNEGPGDATGGNAPVAGNGNGGAGGGSPGGAPAGGTAGVPSSGSGGSLAGSSGSSGSSGSGGVNQAGTTAGGASGSAGTGGTNAGGSPPVSPSDLPTPPGPANLPKPSGAPGDITVVHWAGFKGATSYSFDDNNPSQIQNYTQLNALGVPFTFFLWTGKSDASNAIWKTAVEDGHEIANHTKSHQSAGTTADIDAATTFITQQFGITPWSMAAPNGAAVYTSLAKGRFFINRGVGNALIGPDDNSDPFTLPTYIPPQGAAQAAFNTQVDGARSAGKWRTMCIHGFTGDGSAYQPVPLDQFIDSVKYAKGLGDMWLDTITRVGAYWLGEKAFNAATTMTSGNEKTWTWTLPDKFPTGRYLRVTVAGGTLKQGGVALAWDPHGYYEIALDARSVTLAP